MPAIHLLRIRHSSLENICIDPGNLFSFPHTPGRRPRRGSYEQSRFLKEPIPKPVELVLALLILLTAAGAGALLIRHLIWGCGEQICSFVQPGQPDYFR